MLYQPVPKRSKKQTEHKEERETLNRLYDAFVKKYGNLNSADNIKLIKTDSAGKEIPYLERVIGGVHKADIFSRPVSFSTTTLATDNPEEALAASLNKYGSVDLDYMSEISSMPADTLKEALHGRFLQSATTGIRNSRTLDCRQRGRKPRSKSLSRKQSR
jgi:N12 class adenine-specific DNA methylase